jgi:glycosyltransferase involved in cell wall biosynthesis
LTATRIKRLLSVQNVWDGGGSEKALIRMIRQLRADGWDCHVAIGGPPRLAEEYARAGATVHVVPMERITTSGGPGRWVRYLLAWPVSVIRLTRLTRRLGIDVVHTNTLHSWYGWAAAALTRRPHVWQAREIVVQSALALRVERWLTTRFARRMVATSNAVAAQFTHPHLEVIFDEVDPGEFRPDRAGAFRARVGIDDEVPLVASVGRIDTWKGVDILLDAVPALQAARPDIVVLVAGGSVGGKEAYAAGLQARADALGVRWVGSRDDVADLMADLDVYVMASTEPEPFGLGLVEALASGTPVVATGAGGPVEILAGLGPSAGCLVPPGDAAALADALLALVPARSGAAARAGRLPLRRPTDGSFVRLFDGLLEAEHGP